MPIQIDNSGTTGTITLKSPTVNTNITLTFPAAVVSGSSINTNGAGSLTFAPTGLVGWTSGSNTSAPNVTVNVATFTASGGTTAQGISVSGLGTSNQLLGVVPTGTTAGGNARTASNIVEMCYFSVRQSFTFGLSPLRTAATQIVNADRFISIGGWLQTDTSSTYSAMIGGNFVQFANAPNSVYMGEGDIQGFGTALQSNIPVGGTGNNVAIHGFDSGTFPPPGLWTKQNQVAINGPNLLRIPQSFQFGNPYGGTQMYFVVCAQTTDATATVLAPYVTGVTTDNCIGLGDNSQMTFRVVVTAMVKTPGGNAKMWLITGFMRRGSGVASTAIVGTPTVTALFNDAGASTWGMAVTANATLGSLTLTATGQAATSIQWVASCVLLGIQFS